MESGRQACLYRGHYHQRIAEQEEEFVVQQLLPKQSTILEVGAGNGRVSRHLQVLADQLTVCDVDQDSLEQVRLRLAKADNVQYQPSTFETLDSVPGFGAFDAAVAIRTIPYADDWKAAIQQLAASVRSGGLVLFDLWNRESFEYKWLQARGFEEDIEPTRLTRSELAKALDGLPLELIATFRWGYPRIGSFGTDFLGAMLFPNAAYSTLYCCQKTP